MKPYRLIFIGGVHGTGKGRFCEQLCSGQNWEHLIASELLKWTEYSDDSVNKRVKSIQETQERLVQGLNNVCSAEGSYLLDGHFTLLNNEYEVTRIKVETFEAISPSALLLKTEELEVVWGRLKNRDGRTYPRELIGHMLQEEREHFCEVAKYLGVPNYEITSENTGEIVSLITQIQ